MGRGGSGSGAADGKDPEESASTVELTILANGTVYARNLTASLASVLLELNPADGVMRGRAGGSNKLA
jgi:hypothetical protein